MYVFDANGREKKPSRIIDLCKPNDQLNVYTTSETEGEVVHVKLFKPRVIHY